MPTDDESERGENKYFPEYSMHYLYWSTHGSDVKNSGAKLGPSYYKAICLKEGSNFSIESGQE